jgi:hypothetical protein
MKGGSTTNTKREEKMYKVLFAVFVVTVFSSAQADVLSGFKRGSFRAR